MDSDALRNQPTIITTFLSIEYDHNLNFNELADLLTEQSQSQEDESNDRRSFTFAEDMMSGDWRGTVDINIGQEDGIANDGIHRGIAYILCINSGKDPKQLPTINITHYSPDDR
jgi:hypothetical protein